MTIDRGGITTFRNNVQFYDVIKLPTNTSNPGSVLGDAILILHKTHLKFMKWNWLGLVVYMQNGITTKSCNESIRVQLLRSTRTILLQLDGGTAFQQYACGALSNLGTIPSGGLNGLVILVLSLLYIKHRSEQQHQW